MKKEFTKKCAYCGCVFNPGRHKEKLNCSKECLKAYQELHKEERIQKSYDAIKEKYGVDHPSKIEGWSKKVKKTKKERYGQSNFNNREKAKDTCQKKYGAQNPMQNEGVVKKGKKTKSDKYSDENFNNREKAKKTIKQKYGVDHHLQTEECLQKQFETNLKKFGVKHPFLTEEARGELKRKNREEYGCDWYFESLEHILKLKEQKINSLKDKLEKANFHFDLNEYTKLREKIFSSNKEKIKYLKYNIECRVCGNVFKGKLTSDLPICRKCYPIAESSKLNKEFDDFLTELNVNFKKNCKDIIPPLELDFFIEEMNIAFELNGNYWHSELSGGKDKHYHISKSKLCNELGIKLIHIFEDEWINKKEIVKSRVKNMLNNSTKKIFARNCKIKEVTPKDKSIFLFENHLQGNCVDAVRYGLYFEDELVSLITFSKKRTISKHKTKDNKQFELTRFCSKINLNIIGAFDKLLNHFKKNNSYDIIITYADCRWSGINPEQTVYFKNGFNFIERTKCSYFYVNKKDYYNRKHRFSLNKQTLIKIFDVKDSNKTEWEIAVENGFDRLWDCGTLKFELKK